MAQGGKEKKTHHGHKPTFTGPHTEASKLKIKEARIGKPLSPTTTDKISDSMKKVWQGRRGQQNTGDKSASSDTETS